MADPLATLADREVPERTNFFDRDAAQSILSRYSTSRRGAESAAEVAKSAGQLYNLRNQEEERVRRQIVWDRTDQEYNDRQEAKLMRGDFLRKMQKEIDPKSESYTQQVVEFKAGLPPELQEDEVINSILSSMNAEADDYRSRRNSDAIRQGNYDFWQKKFEKGADLKFKHLTPEDYAQNRMEDGSPDFRALQALEQERDRGYKEGEFTRRLQAVQEGRMKLADRLDMSKASRALRDEVETYINDPEAFPSKAAMVISEFRQKTQNPKAVEASLTGDWADRLAEAKEWDKKKFERELIAAQQYDDPDDYVNMEGMNLSGKRKEYRRKMWQLANKEDVFDESDGAAAPTEAPSKPAEAPKVRKWNPETKKLE